MARGGKKPAMRTKPRTGPFPRILVRDSAYPASTESTTVIAVVESATRPLFSRERPKLRPVVEVCVRSAE